jgi:hypothetical protein
MQNTRPLSLALLLPLLVALTHCGAPADPFVARPPAGGKADGIGPPVIDGLYLLEIQSSNRLRDRDTDKLLTMETTIQALASLSQAGKQVHLWIQPTEVILPEVSGFQLVLPKSTVALISPALASGEIRPIGEHGHELITEPVALTLGVSLEDPLSDPLPTDPADPSVLDEDGDGDPGVTIGVSVCSIYAGIRLRIGLMGVLAPPAPQSGPEAMDPESWDPFGSAADAITDAITGHADLFLDQEIYGDSIPFYDAVQQSKISAQQYELVEFVNTFWMIPLVKDGEAEPETGGWTEPEPEPGTGFWPETDH